MTTFYSSKGGSRTRDTHNMFAVRYADGRSAYIRVDPKAAQFAAVIGIATARQAMGEVPEGEIVGVQRVR